MGPELKTIPKPYPNHTKTIIFMVLVVFWYGFDMVSLWFGSSTQGKSMKINEIQGFSSQNQQKPMKFYGFGSRTSGFL